MPYKVRRDESRMTLLVHSSLVIYAGGSTKTRVSYRRVGGLGHGEKVRVYVDF